MRKILIAIVSYLSFVAVASAQSNPGWEYGFVPTPAQWNAELASKQDFLGGSPCLITGCTMTGPLITAASTTLGAGLNLQPGVAPTSPNNGDLWTTSGGIFAQINGATINLTGAASTSFAGTPPITVSFPAGVVTYACATCGVTGSPLSQFAATTSAQLRGVLSDESGTGAALFQNGALGTATATSLAIGGATIGSNALAVTGGAAFSANVAAATFNGLTITTSTGGLVIGNGKSLTAASSLTLIGIDGTSMTFPSTSAAIARTDAGQTFTGTNTFGVVNLNAGGALAGTFTGAPTLSGANFVTLSNLVPSTAGAQFLGVTGASAGNYAPFTLASLTALTSPSTTLDLIPCVDHTTGTIKSCTPSAIATAVGSGVTSLNGLTGVVLAAMPVSGGRITPSSGVCVPTTDVAAATSIFLAPCGNPYVQIYNGTNVQAYNFTSGVTDTVGLTLALGSNWAANTLYDVYATLNGGVPVLATVAWTSSGAGTSARATALALYNAIQTNATSATARISNSSTITMAANQGTYVGTFITNGSTGQIDFKFGTSAAGGGAAVAGVWNMYNRTPGAFAVNDSVVNFATSATSTFQPMDVGGTGGGLNNRITFVTGTGTDPIDASLTLGGQPSSGTMQAGIGINTTSGINTRCVAWLTGNTAAGVVMHAPCRAYGAAGLNYAQGIQWSTSNASPFISGPNGGLTAMWWW